MNLKKFTQFILLIVLAFSFSSCKNGISRQDPNGEPGRLFEYNEQASTRWVSFENPSGAKGQGGIENYGAKGHPCDFIKAGESKTLFDMQGPGIINRIWITISDRSPEMLRSLVINMYWDNETKPAVSVPFGDFFGVGLGRTAVYENALFANPEGRSFNSFIQMPFKTAARIEILNESATELSMIFYDVNLQLMDKWEDDWLYFHCYWHRDTATVLAEDFEILPAINGKGRFIGTNVSVNANPDYKHYWWGEGEVKIYLDGDDKYPTLAGTGTEDYIGTAWGQGQYFTDFAGCLVADPDHLQWAFYRYHIPDPVFFRTACRVTIQQIGGTIKNEVIALQEKGVALIPITIHEAPVMHHIYYPDSMVDLNNPDFPEAWVNFYRSDDVAAAAYFYRDSPSNDLPPIQSRELRTWNLSNH